MATVVGRWVVIRQGTVWVDVTSDDVTGRIASVTSHNPLATPVGRIRVSRLGTAIIDTAIPPGDVTTAIPGNVQVDQISVYATDSG